LGRWGQAASDYEKAGALGAQPSWLSHYRSALAYLGAGNTEGYRKACMRYLDALAASEDTQALRFAAWTCALAPAAVPEPERLVTVAKKALTGKPEDYDLLQVYGAALYRAGRPAEAVAALEKADTGRPGNSIPLYSWFFLALAHHRLGHQEEAHRWLARARTEAGQVLSLKPDAAGAPPWNRRLTLRLLLAEADREIIPEGR